MIQKENRRRKKSERSPRKVRQAVRRQEGNLGYAKARLKTIRMAPRKVRLVADQIRNQDLEQAQNILEFSPRAAARPMLQLLLSARANAENDGLDVDALFVSSVMVDEGPTLKRFQPRAMGRASRINKRTSHVTLVLRERAEEEA